jgi:alanyl-tRNA synthetase
MREMLVTYPGGSTSERTAVVAVTRTEGGVLFAVERTPCHPESPRWPDQPADRCVVEVDGARFAVECFEGFLRGGMLAVGEPRREEAVADSAGAPDGSNATDEADAAVACVVHRAPVEAPIEIGATVRLGVDEEYREALSRSHSRCHIVSLALNAVLAQAWRKDPGVRDSLGNPDFDRLAIQSSTIREDGSVDVYRIGRHVRKAGFSAQALEEPDALARCVGEIALGWVGAGVDITVTPGVCRLEERRTWHCALSGGVAEFPCGGTHVASLTGSEGVSVEIAWEATERRLMMSVCGRSPC